MLKVLDDAGPCKIMGLHKALAIAPSVMEVTGLRQLLVCDKLPETVRAKANLEHKDGSARRAGTERRDQI